MIGVVLDASMAMAWFLNDENPEELRPLQNRVEASGAVVPRIWRYEMTNGLRVAEKRGRIDRLAADRILGIIAIMPVVEDNTAVAMERLMEICRTHELTSYDAAYFELAMRRRLPLASLDAKLVHAAGGHGIEILRAGA